MKTPSILSSQGLTQRSIVMARSSLKRDLVDGFALSRMNIELWEFSSRVPCLPSLRASSSP
jgi:hypothetical protein